MTKVDLNIALKSPFAKRYDNYVGGEWRAPKAGKYFDNVSPITGQPVCEIARSDASDVEAALVPGRGGMFSLDNGREKRFLVRSEMCAVPTPAKA